MMEGKAGVNMEFRKKMSRAKSNSPMKRSFRRAVAWLLVFCMCMANMNSAVYAAEIATSSDALMAATPSDATATDSNASEILMPEETISGEELKEEAIRVISAGYEFDFDSEIRLMKDAEGKNESYSDLFKGYRSFTLFGDNGNGGRLTGGSDKAYGYIIVRVEKEAYEAFEKEEGTVKATDSNATDSDAAERSYTLTGNEELVFLYVNADDGSVTFTLNIENLNADDIVVPSHTELYAETEEETEGPAEQPAEDANEAGSPDAGGGSGSGSGDSSSDSEDAPTDEGASDEGQTEGGQTEGGNSGSADADTDTEAPAEKPEDGQTEGGSDSQQENNGSSDTDTENGNTESGNDGNTGNSEDNGSNSDSGNDNHGNADSGNTGNTENSGNSGSGSGSEGGKDEGGSSDKGDSSDKGGSDSGSGSSNSGNSGNYGSGSSSDKGSSDKGGSNSGNSGSSNSGSSSDKGGSDSDSAKLSKSSLNLPMVMGPNPNAEFEEDEFGDMSFDEWQEMMEEEEEEAEEEENYTDEVSVAYDSEDDGISYLNMTMLPAVGATVKKAQPKRAFKLFKSSRSDEAEAVVMAGVVRVGDLVEGMAGATKSIKHLGGDNYRLHLDIAGKGQALDIVLVIDNSNSMYDSKMKNLKEILIGRSASWGSLATEGFVDQVFAKNPESRIAVVSYENTAKVECQWSSNKNAVEGSIKAIEKQGEGWNGKGGTNYEDGLLVARDVLKTKDPTHLPYVVFLSDGDPTYADWPENKFGDESDYSGSGQSADSNMEKDIGWDKEVSKNTVGEETIFAAKAFREDPAVAGTTIYSVGIGEGYEEKYLKAVAGNSDEFVFSGKDLKETFDKIFESLKLEDVKIEDTLSRYVELPEGSLDKANVRVYKTDSSGRETDLRDNEYNLAYDSSTKKLTLDLSAAEQSGLLKEGYTYAVEFDIRVTQEAKNEFEANGYPENSVGGQDTGSTSEGNPGFPSNDVAKVTWKNNSTGYTYPVPVVQVIETPKVQYNKRAVQSTDNKEIYDLILDVTGLKKTPDSSTTTTSSADIVFVLDRSTSMLDELGEWWEVNRPTREKVVNDSMEYILSEETGVFQYSDEQKKNIRVKGYLFSNDVTEKPGPNKWFTSSSEATRGLKVDAVDWNGGTYPKEALQDAIDSFDNSKADLKYIIYLTDGDPSDESDESGGLNVLKRAGVSGKNIKFYPISIHNNPDDNWNGGRYEEKGTYMEQVAKAARQGGMLCDGVYRGVKADEIKKVFQQITDSIVTEIEQLGSGMTNVVISDELSEYAEFASADFTEQDFTVTRSDGKPVDYVVTLPNETEKKFSISFKEPLEEGVTYQVKIQIKPTQAAMDYYAQNGTYPNTPDADTGTHADKHELGFYSNTEATLSFSYNGVTYVGDNAFEYPHPVIQILPEGRFVVQKIVTIDDNQTPLAGSPDQEFIIQIQERTADGTNGFKSSVALKDGEMTGTVITEGEKTFNVHEIVPMEYKQSSIVVYENDGNGNPKPETAEVVAEDGNFTVLPGQDLIVRVTNTPVHKDFFHHAVSVTNKTKGDTSTPFSNDLAEQAAKTASRLGLTKKKTELEQEEGDLIA